MATSIVPALVDALVAAATAALPTVRVYDGYGTSSDPTDSLMIGVDDPFSSARADSVSATQNPATLGTARSQDEVGTIRCAAVTTNGNADQKAARDAVYAIAAAVESICRGVANPAFGVAGLRMVAFGPSSTLYQDQTDLGAEAALIFDVAFKARI